MTKTITILLLLLIAFLFFAATAQERTGSNMNINVQPAPLMVHDTAALRKIVRAVHPSDKSNPDSAIIVYRQIIDLGRSLHDTNSLVLALKYAGSIYGEEGLYELAISYYKEAVELCLASPENGCYIPELYNDLASVYEYMYNYGEAARYLYKASTDRHKPSPDFSYGRIYNNLGFILSRVNRPQQSFFYLNKAEALARSSKNQPMLLSGVLLNKATIYIDEMKLDSGIYFLERSLEISRTANILVLKKIALINLGNVYMIKEENKKALNYLLEAKALKGRVNPMYANAGNAMLGGCYCALGHVDTGLNLLHDALNEAKKFKMMQNVIHIELMLSQCYTLEKDYKNALKYTVEYTHLKDSIESRSRDQLVNQYEVKYRTAEKNKELAEKELYISRQDNYLKKTRFVIAGIGILSLLLGITTVSLYRSRRQRSTMQAQQLQLLQQQQKIDQFKAFMEGEEKERTRIARELHDGLGGMMAAVKMNYSMLQNHYEQLTPTNPDIEAHDFEEIHEMLDEVNNELRRTAYNLMPNILALHGIAEALKMYVDSINNYKHLYINLQINGEPEIEDKFFELTLYRITQELIQNVVKHAEATNMLIQLTFSNSRITLQAKDNGKGFDTTLVNTGLGLKNINFRVQSFGGEIAVTSSASTGTSVLIQFDQPIKDHSAA